MAVLYLLPLLGQISEVDASGVHSLERSCQLDVQKTYKLRMSRDGYMYIPINVESLIDLFERMYVHSYTYVRTFVPKGPKIALLAIQSPKWRF